MLIWMLFWVLQIGVPSVLIALLDAIMPCVIILFMIVFLFSIMGAKMSGRTLDICLSAIFRGIGFLFRQLWELLKYIIKLIWRMTPILYDGIRHFFLRRGMGSKKAKVIAWMMTAVIMAAII